MFGDTLDITDDDEIFEDEEAVEVVEDENEDVDSIIPLLNLLAANIADDVVNLLEIEAEVGAVTGCNNDDPSTSPAVLTPLYRDAEDEALSAG